VLAAILAVAAVLRLLGIEHGLPAVYNPDEISIMARALAFAKGDFNPHNFLYPTFYFYVLFGWVGAYFVAGWLAGAIPSLAAFQRQFFVDPSGVYLAGRLLSVACGVATVALVAALARRTHGRLAAWSAALFMAAAPFAVQDAHYVKHDVPATVTVVLAHLAFVSLIADATRHGSVRRVCAAGAACGVAFSTHYYTVFLALPLAAAVVWSSNDWRSACRGLATAAAAASVVFFALSPFLLPELGTAVADISANRAIVVDRAVAGRLGPFASAGAYMRMLAGDAAGWPVAALALAGVPLLWRLDRRKAVLLLLFPLAFLAFISNTVPATRYLNPILPSLTVLAGVSVATIAERQVRARTRVAVALMLVAAIPGLWQSIRVGLFFRQTDTRTLALRYIEAHVPAGSSVGLQPQSVPLIQSRESLMESLRVNLGDPGLASPKFAIRLGLDPYPAPAFRTIFIGDGGLDADKIYVQYRELGGERGLDALRARGVGWVVLKRFPRPQPDTVPFNEALRAEGRLVASFSPYRDGAAAVRAELPAPYLHNTDARITPQVERPGPLVEVWQLADPRATGVQDARGLAPAGGTSGSDHE
jgi:hypothetical protein